MNKPLPQQQLLLELLEISGDIAVPSADENSVLFRTFEECKQARWIVLSHFGAGFDKASITALGLHILKKSR